MENEGKVIKISSGDEASLFLFENKTLIGGGYSAFGVLATPTDQNEPFPITIMTNVSDFLFCGNNVFARTELNTTVEFYSWGRNNFGAVGTGTAGADIRTVGINTIFTGVLKGQHVIFPKSCGFSQHSHFIITRKNIKFSLF